MPKKGFTLIELLVVISIIGLLGIVAIVNLRDLAQDQVINKAIGEIQTNLRLAQANATSGLICQGESSVNWSIQINADNVKLRCKVGDDDFVIKTTELQNAEIESYQGSLCTSSTTIMPLTVTYSKRSGTAEIDGGLDCVDSSANVSVNVKNKRTENIKSFTISEGGAIDVE